ncbi:MAG: hypothetical protein IPJ30_13735 [Acidobacteria bacterium]|nr:hypothetical protein [Acidobacteriota bacterium]
MIEIRLADVRDVALKKSSDSKTRGKLDGRRLANPELTPTLGLNGDRGDGKYFRGRTRILDNWLEHFL